MDHGVLCGGAPDHYPVNAGIDDKFPAHGTGCGVWQQFSGLGIPAGQVKGSPQNSAAGGRDDTIGLSVDRAAELIPLPGGNLEGLPGTAAQVGAVPAPPGSAVVTRGDNLIVFDNNGQVIVRC